MARATPTTPCRGPENNDLYKKYQALAEERPDVHFVGRLATYKYYNMDQVVAQALSVYARLVGQKRAEATRAILAAPQIHQKGEGDRFPGPLGSGATIAA